MRTLYLTADQTSGWTGGQQVTFNEASALEELGGECEIWDRGFLKDGGDPFGWDRVARDLLFDMEIEEWPKLCHIYAGCFTKTVEFLKERGCYVSYTVAAHDVDRSRKAHVDLGIPFNYEHLNDPEQFKRYIGGYLNADVVVCPSTVSAETVRRQGRVGRVEVLSHGCKLIDDVRSIPKRFVVGYLGSCGAADKGVRYLLEAWKKLDYRDGVLLLGGSDSTSDWVRHLCQKYGGGSIVFTGWLKDVSDFYNQISLLVQPSCTEGFGMEVLEAQAHGRVALCSEQAGAVDMVDSDSRFQPCDSDGLASLIESARQWNLQERGAVLQDKSKQFTWEKIKKRYVSLWQELLK